MNVRVLKRDDGWPYPSALLVYLVTAVVVVRRLASSAGTIGLRNEWSIPPFSEQIQLRLTGVFSMVDPVLSQPALYNTQLFYEVIEAVFSGFYLLDGDLTSKVTLIVLLAFAGYLQFKLCRKLRLCWFGSLLAGLFYMLSPGVFVRVTVGHVYYLASYALLPAVALTFLSYLEDDDPRSLVISAVVYAVAWVQIQFVILIPVVIGVISVQIVALDRSLRNGVRLGFAAVIVGSLSTLLHSYWILPLIMGQSEKLSLSSMSPLEYYAIQESPTLITSFYAGGFPFPSDYSALLNTGSLPESFYFPLLILPAVALLSLVFRLDDSRIDVRFALATLFALGIFLLNGPKPPFGDVWTALFLHFPPMRVFRQVHHFYPLISFPITVLLAYLYTSLNVSRSNTISVYSVSIILVALLLVTSYSAPFLTGDFHGEVQTYDFSDYRDTYEEFDRSEEPYRVFWTPALGPIKYDNARFAGDFDPLIRYSPKQTFSPRAYHESRAERYSDYVSYSLRTDGSALSAPEPMAIRYVLVRNAKTELYKWIPGPENLKAEIWRDRDMNQSVSENADVAFRPEMSDEEVKVYELNRTSPYVTASSERSTVAVTDGYEFSESVAETFTVPAGQIYFVNSAPREVVNRSRVVFSRGDNLLYEYALSESEDFTAETSSPSDGWANDRSVWWMHPDIAAQTPDFGRQTLITTSEYEVRDFPVEESALIARYGPTDFPETLSESDYNLQRLSNGRIEVTTQSAAEDYWPWIIGKNITDFEDAVHVRTSMKYDNVRQSHVVIQGFDHETGEWRQLDQVPHGRDGSSDGWEDHTETVFVPSNVSKIRPVLNPGWQQDENRIASTSFNDVSVYNYSDHVENQTISKNVTVHSEGRYGLFVRYLRSPSGGRFGAGIEENISYVNSSGEPDAFEWKRVQTRNLSPGEHRVELQNVEGLNAISAVSLVRMDEYRTNLQKLANETDDAEVFYGIVTPYQDAPSRNATGSGAEDNGLRFESDDSYSESVRILKGGAYRVRVDGEGNYTVQIENESFSVSVNGSESVGPIDLEAGTHSISVSGGNGTREETSNASLDGVWLHSASDNLPRLNDSSDDMVTVRNVEKVSPTRYEVRVNASEPYLLSFGEEYDPYWVAEVKTEEGTQRATPIPLYGVANGYHLQKTGEYTITIRYRTQRWLHYGLAITGVALSGSVAYLFYRWRRRSGDGWASELHDLIDRYRSRFSYANWRS